ncbi:unnamed protein product [Brachionus calyciflorus]|uniref:EML-like second beta-propeller domain-containing protein n=1 Tax=Brachionus calyciflorus TaxID=104777 RepID=A0A813MWC1_9BILA|nr:unnamed protein product [Brachionus calyciflorus]
MSIGIAQMKQVIGLRGHVTNCIVYQDEQTIVYPAGSNIIIYNVDQKIQKFIPNTENSILTTMCVSQNKRYIAVAEKIANKPIVTIYDLHTLRKRKALSFNETTSHEIVSIAFSPDSKHLITQTGAPDWTLYYWSWEKSKIMAFAKVTANSQTNATVTQISFNPQDNSQICAIGNSILKMYRYADGILKNISSLKQETHNFISHTWLNDEKLIAGNDRAELFLVQNSEILMEYKLYDIKERERQSMLISSSNASTEETSKEVNLAENHSVTSIIQYSKGFIASCGRGRAFLYEKNDDKEFYRKTRELKIPADQASNDPTKTEDQVILSMCISPSEETLLAVTDWQQIYQLIFSNIDVGKSEHAEFEYMNYSYHHGAVTGVDVCIRKPIIATCSTDRSVRIWNFETGVLEIYREFSEEAFSIALHPSGLYVLVGFSDKLRLMNILIDDIKQFKEFTIRGCKECSFSNGGHLFAAVHGNVIQIYSTTNFENISNLKGHNGKVRQILWSNDDTKLISCGMDGAVYEWDTITGKRTGEYVLKNCSYTSVGMSPDAKNIYAVGSDRKLKEITDSQILREIEVEEDDVIPTTVGLSRSGRMLFVGTNKGALRSYKFPLTKPTEFQEHTGHTKAITRMKVSWNDEYAITSSEDGTIVLWKIQDKEGRAPKRDKETGWAEEILITKSDLEEKNQLMVELRNRVNELKTENEYQMRLKDMSSSDKIKELTEKFIQEMESLKTKNQVLKSEKEKSDAKHEQELANLYEKHNKELQDLESTNNQKLMMEYDKYQDLQTKTQKIQEDYERQLTEMEQSKEKAINEMQEHYENVIHKLNLQIEKLNAEKEQQTKEYEETKRQIEEDCDTEIIDIKTKYEQRLKAQIETNEKDKSEAKNYKNKNSKLVADAEEFKKKIEQLNLDIQKSNNMIASLKKDIEGSKKEIQERDDTIQDKEKRIYDLKKKNQELEKFKFVLDYKIKEQKKMVEPREMEIKDLKEEKTKMESELERFNKQNNQLDLINKEKDAKLEALQKELREERANKRKAELELKQIKTDIHNTVGFIQDPKVLKEKIKSMFTKHVHDDVTEAANVDQDIQKEYARQRDHLEKTVNSLKHKLVKDSEIHKSDNIRIMQENVTLIKEVNDLRRELKISRSRNQDLETALGISRKNAASTTEAIVQALHVHQGNHLIEEKQNELERIIEHQKQEIKRLRGTVEDLERRGSSRPTSTSQLPPMPMPVK